MKLPKVITLGQKSVISNLSYHENIYIPGKVLFCSFQKYLWFYCKSNLRSRFFGLKLSLSAISYIYKNIAEKILNIFMVLDFRYYQIEEFFDLLVKKLFKSIVRFKSYSLSNSTILPWGLMGV